MMFRPLPFLILVALIATPPAQAADDDRVLVKLPDQMRQHMLGNMRDHLRSLEEMMAALAAGKSKEAGTIAEQRIGMTSLILHGAEHMGRFMPEGMQRMGAALHHAASRFAITAVDAELEPEPKRREMVYTALGEVLSACNSCHSAYRIQ